MRADGKADVEAVLHLNRTAEEREWRDAEIGLLERQRARRAKVVAARLDLDRNSRGARDGSSVTYAGRYVSIVPNRHLVFTLALPQRADVVTRVTVDVDPAKSGSTMTLLHENVSPELASRVRARWTGMFHGLGLLLDSGAPVPESFDDRHCRFQGVPIDYNAGPRFTITRSER